MDGKGHEFLEYYYEYTEKIFNKQIPLSKIANKARVKQSIKEYKVHITKRTKSGSLMSRQAHMELAIKHNLPVGLGDTIYYVNNGEKKSHGDVQKKNVWNATAAEKRQYKAEHGVAMPPDDIEVVLNCYLIDEKDIANEPDRSLYDRSANGPRHRWKISVNADQRGVHVCVERGASRDLRGYAVQEFLGLWRDKGRHSRADRMACWLLGRSAGNGEHNRSGCGLQ